MPSRVEVRSDSVPLFITYGRLPCWMVLRELSVGASKLPRHGEVQRWLEAMGKRRFAREAA
jgi:hypothetical protein